MSLKNYLLCWLTACVLCWTLPAAADDAASESSDAAQDLLRSRTLWLVEGRGAQTEEQRLRDAFAAASSHRNLVGTQGIQDAIDQQGLSIPRCLDGTGECKNQRAAAMQALGVERLVRLNIQRRGRVETFVYDDKGDVSRHFESSKSTTQQAIMDALSEVTGATGRLRIDTDPQGATVLIDGKEQGETPFAQTMDVGSYDVEVRYPGYSTVHESVDVPPDGRARRQFTLERRAATLIVRSGTPTAVVRIDDNPEPLPANEALLVEPGVHRITVEADGYDSVSEHFDFEAGKKRELNATLALSMKEVRKRHTQRIIDRPLLLQAGLRYMHFNSDWAGARGKNNSDHIECAVRPTTGDCDRSAVHSIGLDLSAIFTWKYLDVEVFGVSFYALAQPSKSIDFLLEDSANINLSHSSGNRTLFRLGHVGARYLINEHFEPYARVGFSFAADRVRAKNLSTDDPTQRFKRASVLLELRGGMRMHVNELFYAYSDLGVGFDITHGGNTPAFELGAGVGINLPMPFQSKKKSAQDSTSPHHAYDAVPQEL